MATGTINIKALITRFEATAEKRAAVKQVVEVEKRASQLSTAEAETMKYFDDVIDEIEAKERFSEVVEKQPHPVIKLKKSQLINVKTSDKDVEMKTETGDNIEGVLSFAERIERLGLTKLINEKRVINGKRL